MIKKIRGTLSARSCRREIFDSPNIVIPDRTTRRPPMKQKILITFLALIFTAITAAMLTAQEEANQKDQKYKTRYSKDLFNEADGDNDGYISWAEAKSSSKEIERDVQGRKRFNSADLDNDGRLSAEEARKYRGFEARHRDGVVAKTKERKGNGHGDPAGVQSPGNTSSGAEQPVIGRKKTIRTTDKERVVEKRLNRKESALEKRNRKKRRRNRNISEADQ